MTTAAALAWLYLLTLHGGYWRTSERLPSAGNRASPLGAPGRPTARSDRKRVPTVTGVVPARNEAEVPTVTAVVPARNEAEVLPRCLSTLLAQDYPGLLRVVVVDDDSTDGTAAVATQLGAAAGRDLLVIGARPTAPGWAGKVWAMSEGVAAVGSEAEYILFTDADIAYAPGTLTRLVRAATGNQLTLVSQMALLRASTGAEKLLIPAFVYFFAQLYPFRRVNRPRSRTAAAAGGCMLVRSDALAAAGGLGEIRSARIDDVALGTLVKRAGGRCWLGLTTDVTSLRRYDRLADIWDMVARSAYTQLRYSLIATVGCVLALAWLYLLPPVAAVAGLALLAAGGSAGSAGWLLAAGIAGWLLMTVSYAPMLRFYRLSPLRAPSLPLIAALYAAMTADSARRHLAGRGGAWKGRVVSPGDT